MIFGRPTRHVLIALGVGAVGAAVLAVLASRGPLADHWGSEWDGLPNSTVQAVDVTASSRLWSWKEVAS